MKARSSRYSCLSYQSLTMRRTREHAVPLLARGSGAMAPAEPDPPSGMTPAGIGQDNMRNRGRGGSRVLGFLHGKMPYDRRVLNHAMTSPRPADWATISRGP